MNINQAKNYIKDTVNIYLKKDEFGDYIIPVVRQRPVFLLGAPGIGKTAIMEQIAEEMSINLVSYSMTHHTRQSALGLPFITKKNYGGEEVSVSEYTMSEIIATIYDTMEITGIDEGILFLDEINCVSETLAPSMLQFLQYKVFGKHKIPEGWVVVTAGNPPEYNKSVREFDIVTMDRLKVLSVEAEYDAWRKYAVNNGVHSAIISFLDSKKEFFYKIETTVAGRTYVTARGWEDLSTIMKMYEEENLAVTDELIAQYIRNERIVREFSAYYDLYIKYKKDYQVEEILSGFYDEARVELAKKASFDERFTLIHIICDKIFQEMREAVAESDFLKDIVPVLRKFRERAEKAAFDIKVNDSKVFMINELKNYVMAQEKLVKNLATGMTLSEKEKLKHKKTAAFLREVAKKIELSTLSESPEIFDYIKELFDAKTVQVRSMTGKVKSRLHNAFSFIESIRVEDSDFDNELMLFVTELTVNNTASSFIGRFGSEDYDRVSKDMMVSERRTNIVNEIDDIFRNN